jgi:hypothetical protein
MKGIQSTHRLIDVPARKGEGEMSAQEGIYQTEYRSITIRTTDGSTLNGQVNISPDQRVSDLFTRSDKMFIVMVGVTSTDTQGKTRFINKDHIVWVEPEEF